MGIELHSTKNPFVCVLKDSSSIRFSVQKFQIDDWSSNYNQPIASTDPCNSMARFLDKQIGESIKKTMQTQDEIFKHQVGELHRLYDVQKMMMDEMMTQQRHWTNLNSQYLAFAYNNNNNNNNRNLSIERRGSCSADRSSTLPRKWIKIVDHQETSGVDVLDDSKRLVLFDQMRRNGPDVEDSDLELTLSIGASSSSYQRETNPELDSSASFNNQDSSGPTTPISSNSSRTLDREKKRPHWLLQGLTINKST